MLDHKLIGQGTGFSFVSHHISKHLANSGHIKKKSFNNLKYRVSIEFDSGVSQVMHKLGNYE